MSAVFIPLIITVLVLLTWLYVWAKDSGSHYSGIMTGIAGIIGGAVVLAAWLIYGLYELIRHLV